MSAADLLPPVIWKLGANITEFEQKQAKVRGEMHQTTEEGKSKFGAMGSSIGGALGTVATGVGVMAAGLVGIGLKSADTFQKAGMEVGKLSGLTGESAESMSKWRFAAQESGVDSEQLGGAWRKLAKDMSDHNDKLAKYGINTKDASGHLRDMSDIMLDVADKEQKLGAGAERDQMAMDLFGKSGTDMNKMLGKGGDALASMMDEAEKYGVVMGQDQVDAAKKAALAHRQLNAGLEGIQIQLGQYVIPLISTVVGWFAQAMPYAIKLTQIAIAWVTAQWNEHLDTITAVWEYVKTFVVDTVIPALISAIQNAVGWVKTIVEYFQQHQDAAKTLGVAVGTVLVAAIGAYIVAQAAAAIATVVAWAPVILVIALIGLLAAAVYYAYNNWQWFHNAIDAIWTWLQENAPKVWNAIVDAVKAFIAWWQASAWPWLQQQWENFQRGWDVVWPKVQEAWGHIMDAVKSFVDWWTTSAWPTISEYFGYFQTGVATIVAFVQEHWPQIQAVIDAFVGFIQTVVVPIVQWLVGVWVDHLSKLKDQVVEKFNAIKDGIDPIIGFFQDTLWPAMQKVGNFIKDHWEQISGAVSGVWNTMRDNFKTVVNFLIDIWNGFISHFSIPDIPGMPGGGFDGSKHTIPKLARGGIAMARTGGVDVNVAEAGQDEAIAPIDDLVDRVAQGVAQALAGLDFGGRDDRDIVVKIGERELARATASGTYQREMEYT